MVNWFNGLLKRFSVSASSLSGAIASWGVQSSSGVAVSEETALTCSAVFRAVAIISQSLASLPVRVVRVRGNRVERVEDHPVERILNQEFNSFEGSFLGRERIARGSLLSTAGYAEIIRTEDGSELTALSVIHPDRLEPEWIDVGGRWERWFKLDKRDWLPDRKLVQVPGVGFDGLEGMSVIQQAKEAIGHAVALEKYGAANFAGGTAPRGVISTPKKLTDDVKVKMRTSWKDIHSGPNDVAVMDDGYGFTPIDINNEDRQFLQSRSFQVVEIARWFGIPPHMLAELKDANYATTEHLGDEFKTLTLQPWVIKWEQELTRKLLTQAERDEGLRVDLVMDEMFRPDLKTRTESARTLITTGLATVNELRPGFNLPPSDDPRADMLLIQLNIAGADGTSNNNPDVRDSPGDSEQ